MRFWELIFFGDRDDVVQKRAVQVVREQHALLWLQLAARAGSLGSIAEARGYIRSRVVPVLRDGIRHLFGRSQHMSRKTRERVLERAVELITGEYAAQMLRPAPARASVRRAA